MIIPSVYHFYMKLSTASKDIILLNALVEDNGYYLLSNENVTSSFGIHYNDIKLFESILNGTLSADYLNPDTGAITQRTLSQKDSIKNKLDKSNNILKQSFGIQTYCQKIDTSSYTENLLKGTNENIIPSIVVLGKTIAFKLEENFMFSYFKLTMIPYNLTNEDKFLYQYLSSYNNILQGFLNSIIKIYEEENNVNTLDTKQSVLITDFHNAVNFNSSEESKIGNIPTSLDPLLNIDSND